MNHFKPEQFAAAASLEELHDLLGMAGIGPGWNKPTPSIWPSQRKNFLPAHWQWLAAKAALDAAGRFVSPEFAERRNLILANPVPGNDYGTVRTLVAAYQMVLPQETARSHRHTPNALRLVVQAGPKAFTVVDGRKLPMEVGDVLLTPNWAWHGHVNEGEEKAYWIDFLDTPLMHFLEPMFFESWQGSFIQETDVVDAQSPMRFARADTYAKLDDAAPIEPGYRQIKLESDALQTIALHVLRLDADTRVACGRSTANEIFAVMSGSGCSVIDDTQVSWQRGDVFAVPAWRNVQHHATEEAHLLCVSDEPVMSKLGWLRVEPGGQWA